MRSWRPSALVLLLVALASCTSTGGSTGGRRSASADITRAELDAASFSSAYHAIERLRPAWLRARGPATPSNPNPFPKVYVDGMRRGELDELYAISAGDVETIRRLSPSDATTLFGLGNVSGVILVTTSR